jgi:type II secretory pathway pseudopilin PulG
MIELIFVIVIIGILAAVAIPKLAATRDDAKLAAKKANTKTCINDLVSAYTATGTEPDTDNSQACVKAKADGASITVTPPNIVVGSVSDELDGDHRYKGSGVSL